jgi:hypothetical protein
MSHQIGKNMDEISAAINGVKSGVSLLSDAISLVYKTKDLLPESKNKEIIEKSLVEAEKASKLAESQIALALGYSLCKCTFPPQIMLSAGYTENKFHPVEEFVCPKCGKSSVAPVASEGLNYASPFSS